MCVCVWTWRERGGCKARCLPAVRGLKSPSPPLIRALRDALFSPKKADMTGAALPSAVLPSTTSTNYALFTHTHTHMHIDRGPRISWHWGLGCSIELDSNVIECFLYSFFFCMKRIILVVVVLECKQVFAC